MQLKYEKSSITIKGNKIISVSIENDICTKQAEEILHSLCQHHEILLDQQFSFYRCFTLTLLVWLVQRHSCQIYSKNGKSVDPTIL